jgi:hypothetical protein
MEDSNEKGFEQTPSLNLREFIRSKNLLQQKEIPRNDEPNSNHANQKTENPQQPSKLKSFAEYNAEIKQTYNNQECHRENVILPAGMRLEQYHEKKVKRRFKINQTTRI